MILNVEQKLIERLNVLREKTLQTKVSIIFDEDNNLKYIGSSQDYAFKYGAGLFDNNNDEIRKHMKTVSLSEIINGNDEIHINVVKTMCTKV